VIFLLVELPRWVLGAEADVSVGRDEGWLVIFVLVELPRWVLGAEADVDVGLDERWLVIFELVESLGCKGRRKGSTMT
jgi:hypothetical protein